jgi:Tfp pilus assembly protein PilN
MMRALDLDLVRRRPAWPAWLMLVIGIALGAEALFGYFNLRDEVEQLQRRRGAPQIAAPAPKEPVSEQTQRELDAARQILRELALPWEALFGAIEASNDNSTAMLAIEPDAGKRVVRISGEARNYLAVLNFMARLEKAQALSGVHLLSHQIREDVAERPYQFTLSASWRTTP